VFGFVPTALQLSRDTLEVVAVAAAALAGLSLLMALFALARLRALGLRTRRPQPAVAPPDARPTGQDPTALRHVAVVRYDAFGDMGGRLSFSTAVFDAQGDGLIISSINGRSEARTYAKALTGLESDQALSPEELEAIKQARRGG
jgi:hypothetical protein